MKKLWLLFFLVAAVLFTQAQLKELSISRDWQTLGEVKYVGPAKASLRYLPGKSDTTYLLLMRDSRYELKDYFSIRFNSEGGALGNLYQILISFFKKENRKNKNYEKLFNLGDQRVFVQHYRQLTGHQVMLSTNDGHILLGEGEINKLFDKK